MYGEDDAVAEAVVGLACLVADAKARLQQVFLLVALGEAGLPLRVVLVGTKSELEFLNYVVAEAALTEVGQTHGSPIDGVIHLLLEPCVGPFVDDEQALALALLGTLLVGLLALLDFDMVFLGQIAQGIGVGELLVLHDEMHGRASLAAREALADVLRRRYHERRRAVVVERTQPLQVGTRPLQGHEVRHDIHDVCRIQNPIYCRSVYHSCGMTS